jgi:hypothetical protein
MAELSWGEGSEGEAAQAPPAPTPHPALSKQQGFTIDKSAGKNLSQHEHANRVNRIVSTYVSSTPEQQKSGKTWYRQAHRAAVTVANGEDPGIGNNTPAMKRGVYRKPGVTDEHVDRAAGAIARLSPSMPAGMDWEHNAQAAHETGKLNDNQADRINRGLPGARYIRGNSSLHHAGEHAIVHAHGILKGDVSPEEDLNQTPGRSGPLDARKKAGSFYRNIKDPMHSNEVTVDARAVGIAAGKRVGFKDVAPQAGKMEGGRYKDYEGAYQDATSIINSHLEQAGKTANLMPHHVQATTWLADKTDLESKINPTGAKGGHLHAGAGGVASSHRDFPTPAGQERTNSAR